MLATIRTATTYEAEPQDVGDEAEPTEQEEQHEREDQQCRHRKTSVRTAPRGDPRMGRRLGIPPTGKTKRFVPLEGASYVTCSPRLSGPIRQHESNACTHQSGQRYVRVEDGPDPILQEPTDAIIKVTSTAICGSDLHLYEVLGPYLEAGDILGHEPTGLVEKVGPEVTHIMPGDRAVVPINISCGSCWMCSRGFYAQCETTQETTGQGASLFGYTSLYGSAPGGRPSTCASPRRTPARSRCRTVSPTNGPLPLRRGAHALAGGRVRGRPEDRDARGDRPRSHRPDGRAGRAPRSSVSTAARWTGWPMTEMLDRGISMRMGQCHVKRRINDLLPS